MTPTPVVAVLSPNGTQTLCIGNDANLTWTATDNTAIPAVKLEISRDLGATWETLVANTANTGSYTWHVTGPASHGDPGHTFSALFRVTATDDANIEGSDQSDGYFRIYSCVLATPGQELPKEFALSAVWPNPTHGRQATMVFSVPRLSHVKLSVVDLLGREVSSLANGEFAAGRYQVSWDGRSDQGPVPAGLYFVRLVTPDKKVLSRVAITQ
jgi:hypothetical protein